MTLAWARAWQSGVPWQVLAALSAVAVWFAFCGTIAPGGASEDWPRPAPTPEVAVYQDHSPAVLAVASSSRQDRSPAAADFRYDPPAALTTSPEDVRAVALRGYDDPAQLSRSATVAIDPRRAARGGSALGTRMTGAAYGDIVRHYARSVGRATAERLRYARGYPQRWAARHPVAADWMRFGSEVVERYNDPGEEALRQGIRALKDLFG